MAESVITKKDIIDAIHNNMNEVSKKMITEIVNAFFSKVESNLEAGNRVRIADFGTFKIVDKPQATGTNPRTKEKIIIPAHKTVKFTPAKFLKEEINQK